MNLKDRKKLKRIKVIIEKYFNIIKLQRKTRKRNYVTGRYYYYYFAKKMTNNTLDEIGSILKVDGAKRNHCDVIHGIKTIDNINFSDLKFKNQTKEITSILKEQLTDNSTNNNEYCMKLFKFKWKYTILTMDEIMFTDSEIEKNEIEYFLRIRKIKHISFEGNKLNKLILENENFINAIF